MKANEALAHLCHVEDKVMYGRNEDGQPTHPPQDFSGSREWQAANHAARLARRSARRRTRRISRWSTRAVTAWLSCATRLMPSGRSTRPKLEADAAELERQRAVSPLAGLKQVAIDAYNRAKGTN